MMENVALAWDNAVQHSRMRIDSSQGENGSQVQPLELTTKVKSDRADSVSPVARSSNTSSPPIQQPPVPVTVRCIVEITETFSGEGRPHGLPSTIIINEMIMIPAGTTMGDVVSVILNMLNIPIEFEATAKCFVEIKNWKPMPLHDIAESPDLTFWDVIGKLHNVIQLRIQLIRPKCSLVEDIKDKLFKMLMFNSHLQLTALGCPLGEDMFKKLVNGRLEDEISEELKHKFDSWYAQIQIGISHPLQWYPPIQGPPRQESPVASSSLQPQAQIQKTRMRTSFDQETEVPLLQSWYSENPRPTKPQIIQYVAHLNNLSPRRAGKPLNVNNVLYWFKNARAAHKRKNQTASQYRLYNGNLSSSQSPSSLNQDSAETLEPLLSPDTCSPQQISPLPSSDHSLVDLGRMEDSTENTGQVQYPTTSDNAINNNTIKEDQVELSQDEDEEDTDREERVRNEESTSSQVQRNPGFPIMPNAMLGGFYHYIPHMNRSPGEMSPDDKKKRNRTFIDPTTEVPLLEKWFAEHTHPTPPKIAKYVQTLNSLMFRKKNPQLEAKNIQFWFKNRRAKGKRLKGTTCNTLMNVPNFMQPSYHLPTALGGGSY